MKSGFFVLPLCLFAFTINAVASDTLLPAGTLLQCTLNEPNISTKTVSVGDPVVCHLRGLGEFGQQAFLRRSYLVGHLEAAKDPGHFVGKGYLQLRFDRIGVPSGDMPIDTKMIAAGNYKVDREGKIEGKGHAKRDAVEWMLPPLWPWKVLMLPARGPRPKLKGETILTFRLMDDVDIPQTVENSSSTSGSGWHGFGQPQPGFYRIDPANDQQAGRLQLPDPNSIRAREVVPTGQHTFYVTYATADRVSTSDMLTVPGMPVFVLSNRSLLAVSGYVFENNRLSYMLASGSRGIISSDEIDWPATISLNAKRGVRVTVEAAPATIQSNVGEPSF
jgi:hypothetical protein